MKSGVNRSALRIPAQFGGARSGEIGQTALHPPDWILPRVAPCVEISKTFPSSLPISRNFLLFNMDGFNGYCSVSTPPAHRNFSNLFASREGEESKKKQRIIIPRNSASFLNRGSIRFEPGLSRFAVRKKGKKEKRRGKKKTEQTELSSCLSAGGETRFARVPSIETVVLNAARVSSDRSFFPPD